VHDYDLIAIGSGPGGQRAAIQAAKLGKRVAGIEHQRSLGGVCVNTGTIPSKTLREAAVVLSGHRERGFYGHSFRGKDRIGIEDLLFRADVVVRNEVDVIRDQLLRNDVEIHNGRGYFLDPHTVAIEEADGHGERRFTAGTIVIAVGTTSTRDPHIPFDGRRILCSDDALTLDRLPRTMAVVGAGIIGLEYASMFAALGVRVTLIDKRPELLPFIDREIVDALVHYLRRNRMTIWLGEEVESLDVPEGADDKVRVHLASGKHVIAEKALYSIGRTGATAGLELANAGLEADGRGRLAVNAFFQTPVPHIYAVGDVIGFPSLASTSLEQGRLAACHAFGIPATSVPELIPLAIYSIPEISAVGRTEAELTASGVPYEVGRAQYREIARGQIIGDRIGLLKLIFHLETHEVLGVHIIGEHASELVHIGQSVMALGGRLENLVDTVFNYPTLAECYKTAALDGINRLDHWSAATRLPEPARSATRPHREDVLPGPLPVGVIGDEGPAAA
jgi:NAD(P) transhydrogenase